jgi:hypothetical protein
MKTTKPFFLMVSVMLFTSGLYAQTDVADIVALREASNLALKSYDNAKVLSFLTDDVLTTTGNGTLLAGKQALNAYILDGGTNKMYWVRTPKEITVNGPRGLAWENGSWNGYDPQKGPDAVVGA